MNKDLSKLQDKFVKKVHDDITDALQEYTKEIPEFFEHIAKMNRAGFEGFFLALQISTEITTIAHNALDELIKIVKDSMKTNEKAQKLIDI